MNRIDQLQKIIDERFNGNKNAFARAIGKTPTHIYQWLNGIRNMTDKTAQHIETGLNLPSNYLFSNKKERMLLETKSLYCIQSIVSP